MDGFSLSVPICIGLYIHRVSHWFFEMSRGLLCRWVWLGKERGGGGGGRSSLCTSTISEPH